jgi:hypothetical protein
MYGERNSTGRGEMPDQARDSREGLTFKAYRGDGAALLAFDLDERYKEDLAGFAVKYETPSGDEGWVRNRLSFSRGITAATTPQQRRWTTTDKAPLQKFHWTHFPPVPEDGAYRYTATAMLFKTGSEDRIEPGPSVPVELEVTGDEYSDFEVGFTRGYVSSQAYVDRFGRKPLTPRRKAIDFETGEFEEQYEWLGYHARRMLFRFLDEAARDRSLTLDVFAYDLNEPDFVRALQRMKGRLRLFLDDSADHGEEDSLESEAARLIRDSAGESNVRRGHFRRLAHHKVLIQRRDGKAVKVLTGSANFSVRGLYVQSNNMLLYDHPGAAGLYAAAFEQAWADFRGFPASPCAAKWFDIDGRRLPRSAVSFAPHRAAEVSLDRVADAVHAADSSVLYAVMEMGGTGRVLEELKRLQGSDRVFTYGMSQKTDGSAVIRAPGKARGMLVPFAYLSEKVPPPFNKEWAGGGGKVIHHKFVVVDFNDSEPVVFTGSSNLAAGGETSNGDNLLAIHDRDVATAFAVEAIKLVDHYYFRALMKAATEVSPLRLKTRKDRWWRRWYEPGVKRAMRLLLVR